MLWVDDSLYHRVATTGELGTGKWHFDEAADKISLTDNPTGKVVETSVTERAFAGGISGVNIKHLTVRRYANSNGYGAIGWQSSGSGWTVEDVTAEENHGAGSRAPAAGKSSVARCSGTGRWATPVRATTCCSMGIRSPTTTRTGTPRVWPAKRGWQV